MSTADVADIAVAGLLLLVVVTCGIALRAVLAHRRINNSRNEWEK